MKGYQTIEEMTSAGWKRLSTFLTTQRQKWIQGDTTDLEGFERELHSQMQSMAQPLERAARPRRATFEREVLAVEMSNYDIDAERISVDGVVCRQVGETTERYMTTAGEVQVKRHMYRACGREARQVCALELRAGIVAGFYTPLAARQAAYVVAHMPAASGAALFAELGHMPLSAGSLDRLPKNLSDKKWPGTPLAPRRATFRGGAAGPWEAHRLEWERELRECEQIPTEAVTVAVSLDGVKVALLAVCRRGRIRIKLGVYDNSRCIRRYWP